MMCEGSVIDLQDLLESLEASAQVHDFAPNEFVSLETMQERQLLRVLSHMRGNKAKAAEILGVGRNTIYQMLRRIGLPGATIVPEEIEARGDGPR